MIMVEGPTTGRRKRRALNFPRKFIGRERIVAMEILLSFALMVVFTMCWKLVDTTSTIGLLLFVVEKRELALRTINSTLRLLHNAYCKDALTNSNMPYG